jgi:hypothetical protein
MDELQTVVLDQLKDSLWPLAFVVGAAIYWVAW